MFVIKTSYFPTQRYLLVKKLHIVELKQQHSDELFIEFVFCILCREVLPPSSIFYSKINSILNTVPGQWSLVISNLPNTINNTHVKYQKINILKQYNTISTNYMSRSTSNYWLLNLVHETCTDSRKIRKILTKIHPK